ncbi:MAG: NAD(P)-dependent alcohol dehydrogenase [Devosia sp.]|uniref:NAD(P)-dependent alcohol dehydrogenase n=1 Tax=Devosia sp. TaxID=1871048 RepID=UPI001AC06331|nr:NAD(P)-dependent alcohol dehydrogenase [Devosia sp.]MBN9315623.1 NAD(P)-dependent alcohol dehydrogenase [Devosia sp.]
MRAAVYKKYGPPDVVSIEEVPKPAPGARDLLVKLAASSVTSGDARLRAFNLPEPFAIPGRLMIGIFGPRRKVLGVEFAGTVEAVGKAVTRFKPGDRVFGIDVFGCHAEYKLVRESECVALMPQNLSFEDAAGVPFGGVTALDFFNRARIQAGQKVLVNGASGCVGAYAVQLARHFGAEVTGVCSAGNAELVRSLGAHRVIDYATTDFARESNVYDLVMDTVGNAPYARCEPILAPTGALLAVLAAPEDMFRRPKGGRRIVGGTSAERPEDLQLLADLLAAGKIKPVIDRVYQLEEIREAYAYVDSGRKRGAVVLSI